MEKKLNHKYSLSIKNGRVKVYINGLVMVSWNQIDFVGYYAFKDDSQLYGLDIYTKDQVIETSYKTKEVWTEVLKLLDREL